MMHFFNQLVEHRCTLISVVISGVIAVLLDKFLKRKSNDLSSNDSIKRKNRLITFGITTELCEEHMRKEFDCGNFNCNYGKLRYVQLLGLCITVGTYCLMLYIMFIILSVVIHDISYNNNTHHCIG